MRDIEYMIDQLSKRIDCHSAKLDSKFAESDRKMDRKFEIVFEKMDDLKDSTTLKDESFNTRLTKVETERGTLSKIITVILSVFGGTVSGWIAKHFG